jgi:sensor histidine kinase YesM
LIFAVPSDKKRLFSHGSQKCVLNFEPGETDNMVKQEEFETKFIFNYLSNIKNIPIDGIIIALAIAPIVLAASKYGPVKDLLSLFVMSYTLYGIVSLTVLFSIIIFRPRTWKSLVLITGVGICSSVIIGLQLSFISLRYFFDIHLDWGTNNLGIQAVIFSIIVGFIIFYTEITQIRLRYRNFMIHEEKVKRLALEKESILANLRMLQAQIEPHFLFNTLSNILSLIDTKPDKGKLMLMDLTKYLRTSLSRTMPEKTTLSQEISMIESYLHIQKIRMDERLNYRISVPDNIGEYSFTPMLLQPLVENAIKYGLEPKEEGGEIIIRATEENDILKIEVADTGLGFSGIDKSGVGLSNVQKRLGLLYGEKGRLTLEENNPHGVRAIIEVPVNEL